MSGAAEHPGAPARTGPWRHPGYTVAFWVLALVGVPVMVVAWFLLVLASLEEGTEQPKALAAGTTMAGTTLVFGVVPLVLAHVVGLVLLCTIGAVGSTNRWPGVLRGAVAVVLASFIGFAVISVLTGGEIIYTPEFVP